MASPWLYALLAAGTAMEVTGYQQAADAERVRQEERARQARENKEMVALQAERQATARSKAYTSFLKNSSAIAGFNRRGDDRSLKAIQKAGKEKTEQELSAIQLQSLFTRGRLETQARFAQLEGQWAADQALMQQMSAVIGNGYEAGKLAE
tara:strand:+ start:258 stop:710 length:453 start_codon:yes stop_codon:yes gene_type:complete